VAHIVMGHPSDEILYYQKVDFHLTKNNTVWLWKCSHIDSRFNTSLSRYAAVAKCCIASKYTVIVT
jgi:hypothetical protein